MKKICMVVVAVMLCAAVFAGCAPAAPAASETPSASASESASASPSAEASESAMPSAEASVAASGDYTSWTKAEWDAASDEQKLEASYVVIGEMSDTMFGGVDMKALIEKARTDEKAKAEMDTAATKMFESIDGFFAEEPDKTLKDMIDMMNELLGSQE